jgi:transposase
MEITTIGLDLAKNVFQVHGADRYGKPQLTRQLRRRQVRQFFARLEPCLVAMEATRSANYWARVLRELGHEVRLIAPQFVKPYVKANKTDAADAEAICEAATRPTMRFVPVKTADQQAALSLHRARSGLVRSRTGVANQIRGLLEEFGVVLAVGIKHVRDEVPGLIEDGEIDLPPLFRRTLKELHAHLRELDHRIETLEGELRAWHRANEASKRLEKIPGVGWLTATALVASIGDAKTFKNGRQLAAWLGLVPRQHSSGGKPRLLGISKRGDTYLRTLLIHGARAAIRTVDRDRTATGQWARQVMTRRPKNVAVVVRANKNARIVWALLAHDRDYEQNYTPLAAAA